MKVKVHTPAGNVTAARKPSQLFRNYSAPANCNLRVIYVEGQVKFSFVVNNFLYNYNINATDIARAAVKKERKNMLWLWIIC
jgi:hypothetical protein